MAAGGCDQEGIDRYLQNRQRWEYFLQPLTDDTRPRTTKTKDEDIMSLSKRDNSEFMDPGNIAQQVILKLQQDARSKETLNPATPKAKLPKNKCQKPDVKKSGSKWTLDMLAKYVESPISPFNSPIGFSYTLRRMQWVHYELKSEIQGILQTLGVRHDDIFMAGEGATGLKELQNYSLSESSIRMILDSLLRYVCRETDTILRTQYPMKREWLPNNDFDYVLIDPLFKTFVGVVEAKKPSTMNENAVVQLLLQLFSLVTVGPELTYFGILSDGYRFLLVSVNKYGIDFERDNNMVLLNKAETWDEFETIVAKICTSVLCCRDGKLFKPCCSFPGLPNPSS